MLRVVNGCVPFLASVLGPHMVLARSAWLGNDSSQEQVILQTPSAHHGCGHTHTHLPHTSSRAPSLMEVLSLSIECLCGGFALRARPRLGKCRVGMWRSERLSPIWIASA